MKDLDYIYLFQQINLLGNTELIAYVLYYSVRNAHAHFVCQGVYCAVVYCGYIVCRARVFHSGT